jgi:glycosidase
MRIKRNIKAVHTVLAVLIFAFLLAGCGSEPQNPWDSIRQKVSTGLADNAQAVDDNYRTWYEVFVWSFKDSNGDSIGDLNGVTEMLDYIQYMGFNGIWLMPIHPSTTYHKYDVTDYYAIDPQYGTMEDFDNLIAECDKRGIAVILDLVINHTSNEHEWFKSARTALINGESDNPYIGYYNFANEKGNGQWNTIGAGWYYECQFWDKMPDLNLENPALRAELADMFKFWLDKGVKGFRLDAAKEYVTGNLTKNTEILSWVNDAVKSIKTDAYLVGEAWEANTGLYEYYKSGLDSFFDFNFSGADGKLAKTLLLKNIGADSYANALLTAEESIRSWNANGTNASFFTNHDTARAAGFLRRDSNLIKMAWGMNLFQGGNAFIYYGEEIGMSGSGKDENKRAPMFWADDKNAEGMTAGPPGMDSQEHYFPTVTEQLGDDSSVLEFIRKAISLRNKYPEIARGELAIDSAGTEGDVCLVQKIYNGKTIGLYYNVSADPKTVSCESAPSDCLSATGAAPTQTGSELTLPPYSITIINT